MNKENLTEPDGCDTTNDKNDYLGHWIVAAICLIAVVAIITTGICNYAKSLVENGYEQVTLQGTSCVCWQKVHTTNE